MKIEHRQPQQLLKWVGNKQRFAKEIIRTMPNECNVYYEPFVGTGAVLGCLRPSKGVAGDTLKPLIDLWIMVRDDPGKVTTYYSSTIEEFNKCRKETYELVRDRFNTESSALDLLFLSRTCYGGVVRFTKDGKISTPIGAHKPISGATFSKRAADWSRIIANVEFYNQSFEKTMALAGEGDVVYCDPPYLCSQSILYGAQDFSINNLWKAVEGCKDRGAKVLLSIDGTKKSGKFKHQLVCPEGLFVREKYVDCGKSMLLRFQMKGEVLLGEDVHDRLLLTW